MSLKSILRVVRRAFAPARAPRADEADLFGIIVTSSERVGHHQHSAVRGSSQSEVASVIGGMRNVRAVQCLGIQEDRHGEIEADAMLLRVGNGLSRIPLEHQLSIYGMSGALVGTAFNSRPSAFANGQMAPSVKLSATVKEGVAEPTSKSRRKKTPKNALALPDLEQTKPQC
jgi:hypothetical protein